MSYATLKLDVDGRGVAKLCLNRPDKRNALSGEMIDELTAAAAAIGSDPAIRAVVLSGSGPVFCAGGDLEWMRAQFDASRETRLTEARRLAGMLNALNTLPKPLIGAIHGSAMGGGVGMACVCDIAFAKADTRFGLTETRLGLIPATIGPYVLARLGEGMARRVFMSARIFDASEAAQLGIIADAMTADQMDARIETELRACLSAAPRATARAKALARRLGPAISDDVIEATIGALADAWEDPEAAEGIAAFFDRRKPGWLPQ